MSRPRVPNTQGGSVKWIMRTEGQKRTHCVLGGDTAFRNDGGGLHRDGTDTASDETLQDP